MDISGGTLLDISHSIGMFYRIPKKYKKKKNATALIYCISDEKYNMENLLKSDMD